MPSCAAVVRTVLSVSLVTASLPVAPVTTSALRPEHRDVPESAGRQTLVGLPMRFEQNRGRVSGEVDYISRGAGYTVYLSSGNATLALRQAGQTQGEAGKSTAITVRMTGAAREPGVTATRELPGRTNHLVGRERDGWQTGIRAYERIEYDNVYPGIDVVYYGNQQRLEYDFVVAPGADPRRIAVAFDGADGLSLDQSGNLVIDTPSGPIVQHAPVIYQTIRGARTRVEGAYRLDKSGEVGFRVGRYDRTLPLVIDPIVAYSTYLGGANGETAEAIATDSAGNLYVAGQTWSLDFPLVNAAQGGFRGSTDAFILKINPAGDTLLYATYLGGMWSEWATDVAVDQWGNAFLYGTTYSPDFPVAAALQTTLKGPSDAFAAKFDATGALVYSTYFGGGDQEFAFGMAVDAQGRAYLSGWTGSPDFPTVNPLQSTLGGTVAFRTTSGGASWNAIVSGLRTTWVTALVLDPQTPATLYAGTYGQGVFKSVDAGTTWIPARNGLELPYVYALAIDGAGVLYAATDAGVYRSDDGAGTWRLTNLNTGSWVSAVAVDPTTPGTVYAGVVPGYYAIGVYKTTDGGATWTATALEDSVQTLSVSPSSPATVYAGTHNGVYRSTDAGATWTVLNSGIEGAMVLSLAIDPTNPQIVFAATTSGLFRTASGGDSWTPVEGVANSTALTVAIAPSSPSTIYASNDFGTLASHDGGETWSNSGLNGSTVWRFAIDPLDPMTVYAASMASLDGYLTRLSADGSSVEFSTYFGGSSYDSINAIALAGDDVYLVGATGSTDLPVRNAIQPAFGGVRDLFVARLTDGTLAYSTYIGGAGNEDGKSIGVDAAGNVYVGGYTLSLDFPLVNAHQPAFGGGYADGFVTKIDPAGTAFVYSTFLGGSGFETDVVVDVTAHGEAVVAGTTYSLDFPTREPIKATHSGGYIDVFAAKYDPTGAVQYSTYLGGAGRDWARAVAIDANGDALVAGATESVDFPTKDALQPARSGPSDAFITRLRSGPSDTTAPTISITSPDAAAYLHSATLAVSYSATDDRSGVASVTATLDGVAVASGADVALLTLSLGAHTLTVTAADAAGNTAIRSVSFTVIANIDSLTAAVTTFVADGRIDGNAWRSLLAKLNDAQQALDRGNLTVVRNKLREFIGAVNTQSGRNIEAGAASLLHDDATFVLSSL